MVFCPKKRKLDKELACLKEQPKKKCFSQVSDAGGNAKPDQTREETERHSLLVY